MYIPMMPNTNKFNPPKKEMVSMIEAHPATVCPENNAEST